MRKNNDLESAIDDIVNEIKRRALDTLRNAQKSAYAEFYAMYAEKLKQMFNDAIDDFYSDYPDPEFYERKKSLYKLLQIKVEKDGVTVWYEPDEMTTFRNGYSGEDGLYDQVFRKGWHGGADKIAKAKEGKYGVHPDTGTPYWRTPVPFYRRWGKKAAVAAISPLDDMKRRIDEYQEKEMQKDFNKIYSKYLNNIKFD